METNTNILNKIDENRRENIRFFGWHYTFAPRQIIEIWIGFLAATLHYFSVGLLLRTLVSPWHRDTTGYGRGFDFKRYLSIWSLNMVSRGVGFIVRSVTIVLALLAEVLIAVIGLMFLALWFTAPLIIFVS